MPGRGVRRLQESGGEDRQVAHPGGCETLVRYDAEVPLLQSEGTGDTGTGRLAVGGERGAIELRQGFYLPRRRDGQRGRLRRLPLERVFDRYSLFHLP